MALRRLQITIEIADDEVEQFDRDLVITKFGCNYRPEEVRSIRYSDGTPYGVLYEYRKASDEWPEKEVNNIK